MERLGSISSYDSQASDQNNGRTTVKLNVYDMVSMAGLNQYSSPMGFGVFHSGVEVFDCEYAYGGHNFSHTGVFEIAPRDVQVLGEDSFKFRETVLIGYTDFHPIDIKQLVEKLGEKFRGDKYHLLHQNCNHFTDALTKVLCGQGIPSWVNRLAYVSSSLPFIERWLSRYMPLAPGDQDLSNDVKDDEPNFSPPTPQTTTDSRGGTIENFWRSTRSLNNGPSTSNSDRPSNG